MTLATLSPRDLETRVAGDPVASRRLLRYLDDLGFRIRSPTTLAFAALCWGEPGWSEAELRTASKRWRDARATGELSTAARRLIVAVCWPRELVEVEYRNYPDMIHGFILMGGVLDTANAAVEECCAALRRAFEKVTA